MHKVSKGKIEEVEALKAKLPSDWSERLAQKIGKSTWTARRLVNGLRLDSPDWKHVLDLIEEHRSMVKDNKEATDKIIRRKAYEDE